MPTWGAKGNEVVKTVTDVTCHMEREFEIAKCDGFDLKEHEAGRDPWYKTYVLSCGRHDGEQIDLFELQRWFDENRDWIDALKKRMELKESCPKCGGGYTENVDAWWSPVVGIWHYNGVCVKCREA
jgi:hypothetical protein